MLKQIVILVFIPFVCINTQSISSSEAEILKDISARIDNFDQINNLVFIEQEGKNNYSFVNQKSIESNAYLKQYGKGNELFIQQIGKLVESLAYQSGNGNYINSNLSGKNVSSKIYQIGDGNRVLQNVETIDKEFIIKQTGNYNEILHLETNEKCIPFKISQNGNGIYLEIINGNTSFKKP